MEKPSFAEGLSSDRPWADVSLSAIRPFLLFPSAHEPHFSVINLVFPHQSRLTTSSVSSHTLCHVMIFFTFIAVVRLSGFIMLHRVLLWMVFVEMMYAFPRAAFNKVPRTGWLKTTEISSLLVLEARIRVLEALIWGLWGRVWPMPFSWVLVMATNLWHPLICGHTGPIYASVFIRHSPCVSVSFTWPSSH